MKIWLKPLSYDHLSRHGGHVRVIFHPGPSMQGTVLQTEMLFHRQESRIAQVWVEIGYPAGKVPIQGSRVESSSALIWYFSRCMRTSSSLYPHRISQGTSRGSSTYYSKMGNVIALHEFAQRCSVRGHIIIRRDCRCQGYLTYPNFHP